MLCRGRESEYFHSYHECYGNKELDDRKSNEKSPNVSHPDERQEEREEESDAQSVVSPFFPTDAGMVHDFGGEKEPQGFDG